MHRNICAGTFSMDWKNFMHSDGTKTGMFIKKNKPVNAGTHLSFLNLKL